MAGGDGLAGLLQLLADQLGHAVAGHPRGERADAPVGQEAAHAGQIAEGTGHGNIEQNSESVSILSYRALSLDRGVLLPLSLAQS